MSSAREGGTTRLTKAASIAVLRRRLAAAGGDGPLSVGLYLPAGWRRTWRTA
jgi:hypothetical protein